MAEGMKGGCHSLLVFLEKGGESTQIPVKNKQNTCCSMHVHTYHINNVLKRGTCKWDIACGLCTITT